MLDSFLNTFSGVISGIFNGVVSSLLTVARTISSNNNIVDEDHVESLQRKKLFALSSSSKKQNSDELPSPWRTQESFHD